MRCTDERGNRMGKLIDQISDELKKDPLFIDTAGSEEVAKTKKAQKER